MTKSDKAATSPVNSKKKSSEFDLDLGKDFLSSWKATSMADDGMDFDFGPAAEGKGKAFKFDKMDMDFSLDAGFDKLSSFKIDMSDLDISSPNKRSGKSKEVSSDGNNRSKRDSFGFNFDFNEFEDLNFGSRPTKVDEKANKNKDRKESSTLSGSGASRDRLTEDVDAMEDDISSKLPASGALASSKIGTQVGKVEVHDARNKNGQLESVIDESCPPIPANFEEQEIERAISPEREVSSNLQDIVQEGHSSEKRTSPELCPQQVVQYVACQPLADNVSGLGTALDTEEVGPVARIASSKGFEQEANERPVAELVSTRGKLSSENPSAHNMMNSPKEKGEPSKSENDNDVLTGNICCDDINDGDLHLQTTSLAHGIDNLSQGALTSKRTADSPSKLHLGSLDSVTSNDEMVPEIERGTVVRQSKYFKRQNGSESELQMASLSRTNLISIGSKRMSTMKNNAADGKREFEAKDLKSGSNFTGTLRSLPKELSSGTPVQNGKTETGHIKGLRTTEECSNADNIKGQTALPATMVAHDIGVTKEELVSKGSDQSAEHTNALRSDVHLSSSNQQANKFVLQNPLNPGFPDTSMTSIRNMKKIVVEKNNVLNKADLKTSQTSNPRVSRTLEANLKPLNSLLPKDLRSMRNKEQNVELQRNTESKRTSSVGVKKQTPPTPNLKRKTFEESAEMLKLTPLKRLSALPVEKRSFIASPERVADKQVRNDENVANENVKYAPRFDICVTEVDTSSAIENDSYIEMAEAYSKELEKIRNMLKKKHEEAKNILVRAIVNTNNLLMLNHPMHMHQEKLRMVQKFAEKLMIK